MPPVSQVTKTILRQGGYYDSSTVATYCHNIVVLHHLLTPWHVKARNVRTALKSLTEKTCGNV